MAKRKTTTGKPAKARAVVKEGVGAPQGVTVVTAPQDTSAPKAAAATISRKEMLREAAIQKRKQQTVWVAAAGVVIALLVGVALYIGYRNSLPVVGETTFPTLGNLHIPLGTVSNVPYNSTPPSSGPHYENLAAWGVQTANVRYEHLIHNLEDGGVVVYYQCDDGCPEVVAELEEALAPFLAEDRHVVLARNDPNWQENGQAMHKDMGARIALVAWRKLLLMEEVNVDTIRTFVEKYEGIDHHRG